MHPYPSKTPFVVEVRFPSSETGWQPIAWPADDADAERLFKRASHEYPTDTLLRLRHGSVVLRTEPANGLGSCTDFQTAQRKTSTLRRCGVCGKPGADFKVDWWDEDDQARTARIHVQCEALFFSKGFRYREPLARPGGQT